MKEVSHRKVLSTLAASGAGAAITSFGCDVVKAWTIHEEAAVVVSLRLASSGQHSPEPLPFDPTSRSGSLDNLIKSHWENNTAGAVKALYVVEHRLGSMS